jgi:hypothetical protein
MLYVIKFSPKQQQTNYISSFLSYQHFYKPEIFIIHWIIPTQKILGST